MASLLEVPRHMVDALKQERRIEVDIHPGRPDPRGYVIAGSTVPLRLGYAAAKLDGAPLYRVIVPRFDWSFVAEDLTVGRGQYDDRALQARVVGLRHGSSGAVRKTVRVPYSEDNRNRRERTKRRYKSNSRATVNPVPSLNQTPPIHPPAAKRTPIKKAQSPSTW